MKLPSSYFENLSTQRYREYLKLLPDMQRESTRAITMLIFTFITLSIFGVFAIEPTLTTIFSLRKQLADSTYVKEQLTTKIGNLSALQQQYTLYSSEFPIVFDAVPNSPDATRLAGQIAGLSQNSGLTITSFRLDQVQLSASKTP